jgi:hypothetical protein
MTDWLPWGFVFMVGSFATLYFSLQAIEKTPVGQTPNLRKAKLAFNITIALSLLVYSMYLAYGEAWIWYLRY